MGGPGGKQREVKEEKEGVGGTKTTTHTPLPNPSPPPRMPKVATGKRKKWGSESDNYASPSPSSNEDSPTFKKNPHPQDEGRPHPKREEGGGGRRKRRGGKRGGGPTSTPPSYGMWGVVPMRGSLGPPVTGAHARNSGVVWVKHPNNPKLYKVERHPIFGCRGGALPKGAQG